MARGTNVHVVWEGWDIWVVGSIIPSASKLAICELPVNSIGLGLNCMRGRYGKLKGFQDVTIGQHCSDADEPLLQSFLAFSYLEGAHHRREKE